MKEVTEKQTTWDERFEIFWREAVKIAGHTGKHPVYILTEGIGDFKSFIRDELAKARIEGEIAENKRLSELYSNQLDIERIAERENVLQEVEKDVEEIVARHREKEGKEPIRKELAEYFLYGKKLEGASSHN